MKKLFVVLVVISLVSLFACNNDVKDTGDSTINNDTIEQEVEDIDPLENIVLEEGDSVVYDEGQIFILDQEGEVKEVIQQEISDENAVEIDSDNPPIIEFEHYAHDFGDLSEGAIVAYSFKFTNKGGSPLVIEDVVSSCGCTVPIYPEEPIVPGDTKYIEVKFSSNGRPGFNNKTITILSNAKVSTSVLSIQANVI